MAEKARARVSIKGLVQGVFFRQSTMETARQLGVAGWVRNESDGSVAAEIVGSRQNVEKLIAWCHKGPPSARVDKVDVQWLDADASDDARRFEVLP